MRRLFLHLIIIAAVTSAILFFARYAAFFLAKANLKDIFPGASVSIGKCDFKPFTSLSFSDIEIKKGDIYDLKINRATAGYNLFSLIKGHIPEFFLNKVELSVNTPNSKILDFKKNLNLKGAGVFRLDKAVLSNLDFKLKTQDMNLNCLVSVRIDLIKKAVISLDLKTDTFDYGDLHVAGILAKFNENKSPGSLYIEQIKFGKVGIRGLKAVLSFKENALFLESLSAETLDGKILGNLNLKVDKNADYTFNLQASGLNIETAIRDFNLEEKLQMSGFLAGDIILKGKNSDLEIFKADLGVSVPGGSLTIKDTRFLENMAQNMKQSLDILVKSFKDYHYDAGIIKLSLEGKDLIIGASLDGETGKRNLSATIHDFNLTDLLGKENLK